MSTSSDLIAAVAPRPCLFALALLLLACDTKDDPSSGKGSLRPIASKHDCFTAVADGAQPAQAVFEQKGRSGNGETWFALLMPILEEGAEIGSVTVVQEMGFGTQHEVKYRGRGSWIGYDIEAGGAIFCTPDPELLSFLKTNYDEARQDPKKLAALIDAVPSDRWDD